MVVLTALVALGGYFSGAVAAALPSGNVARMFSGSPLELAVQYGGAVLALLYLWSLMRPASGQPTEGSDTGVTYA